MSLKRMYNLVICGMTVLLIVILALLWNFNLLLTESQDINNDGVELITLSNDMLHVNNYLVKLMRLFAVNNDAAVLNEYDSILNDYESLDGKLDKMLEIGLNANEEKQLDELLTILDQLAAIEGTALDAFDSGDVAKMESIIFGKEYSDTDTLLANKTSALIADITARVKADALQIQNQIYTRIVFIIIFMTLSIACFILLQLMQRNRVLKPVEQIKAITNKISKGDVDVQLTKSRNDEIGSLFDHINVMINEINKQCRVIEKVASGDLTVDIDPRSDKDTMNSALHKMAKELNSTFSEIASSTAQVATGARQISDEAQTLANGASEQMNAIDRLSNSISGMSKHTKENAGMADKAAALADSIKENAEKGTDQMNRMMQAVKDINDASQSISKVIQVIDSIAFQTNILALNAAVEAARAGQHGKGFAVVAEEVRSLAAKSADAAKDTGSLITNSREKAELGARIAEETAASLAGIVEGIGESTELVRKIADSSEVQNMAIAEINNGINQLAQFVHQNTAATEGSAAASEEMSSQSDVLRDLVSQFKLKNHFSTVERKASSQINTDAKANIRFNTESGYGKY